MFKIVFTEYSAKNPEKLDKSIRIEAIKNIEKLAKNPEIGEKLGNKMGIDLSGFYRLYVFKKKIRIIYSVDKKKITIKIVAIGKRDKAQVYKDLIFRLN